MLLQDITNTEFEFLNFKKKKNIYLIKIIIHIQWNII